MSPLPNLKCQDDNYNIYNTTKCSCFSFMTSAGKRSRDLGIPFDGCTGASNSIIDVTGVCVGNVTYMDEEAGVFTGVTAILPHGQDLCSCFAAASSFNGNGEMTGLAWIDESGLLETPVLLTNTHSVGLVRDSVIKWMTETQRENSSANDWGLPVVLETYDGSMNSSLHHVQQEDVFRALNEATKLPPLPMGSVGGGTGNIAYDFKAGCGTSSRVTPQGYTVGVWCQVNMFVVNPIYEAINFLIVAYGKNSQCEEFLLESLSKRTQCETKELVL